MEDQTIEIDSPRQAATSSRKLYNKVRTKDYQLSILYRIYS